MRIWISSDLGASLRAGAWERKAYVRDTHCCLIMMTGSLCWRFYNTCHWPVLRNVWKKSIDLGGSCRQQFVYIHDYRRRRCKMDIQDACRWIYFVHYYYNLSITAARPVRVSNHGLMFPFTFSFFPSTTVSTKDTLDSSFWTLFSHCLVLVRRLTSTQVVAAVHSSRVPGFPCPGT